MGTRVMTQHNFRVTMSQISAYSRSVLKLLHVNSIAAKVTKASLLITYWVLMETKNKCGKRSVV